MCKDTTGCVAWSWSSESVEDDLRDTRLDCNVNSAIGNKISEGGVVSGLRDCQGGLT